jgi:hypothetical protein
VTYRFHCHLSADELQPRTCQCLFCRPRGASYISDPAGRLEVHVKDLRYVYAHVFGTATADFMHCGRCNHLVYVSSEIEGQLYGLVVQQSLDVDIDPGRGRAMNFSAESLATRLERRAESWIPEVVVLEASGRG